jgi:hypothetical protein
VPCGRCPCGPSPEPSVCRTVARDESVSPGGPMIGRRAVGWRVMVSAALCGLAVAPQVSCGDRQPFRCGEHINDRSSDVSVCDGATELCVCARRACARRVEIGWGPMDAGMATCSSAGAAGASAGTAGTAGAGAGMAGSSATGGMTTGVAGGAPFAPAYAAACPFTPCSEDDMKPRGCDLSCPSGYCFDDEPFAPSEWAGRCVPLCWAQGPVIREGDSVKECQPFTPASPNLGFDGGTSGGGAAANAGAAGSGGIAGTAGSGGMAGMAGSSGVAGAATGGSQAAGGGGAGAIGGSAGAAGSAGTMAGGTSGAAGAGGA